MLQVKNLTTELFKSLNFEIRPTEISFILGSSGAGKSSFLRVLNGLSPYAHGSVTLDGKKIDYDGKFRYPQISLVFQQFHLFSHLSVIKNIEIVFHKVINRFLSKNDKLSAEEITRKSMLLLERFGLTPLAYKSVDTLSGGQQQRLAIARALALKPQVLCFDEPTASLDPVLVKDIGSLLQDLAREGLAIIVATHDTGLLKHCPGKWYLLSQGIFIEEVESREFAENPFHHPKIDSFLEGQA